MTRTFSKTSCSLFIDNMIVVKGGPLPEIDSVSSILISLGMSVISNSEACRKNLFFDSEILILVLCKSPNSFFIINSLVPGLTVSGICKVAIKFPCLSVLMDFREILSR